MGSGETAPTMVPVHVDLLRRLGGGTARAVLIDTPYGFQQNADDISARTVAHFALHVGHPIAIASFRRDRDSADGRAEFIAQIEAADYVFAGPGSPSYALRHWRASGVADALRSLTARGGCLTFASAAAVSLGAFALPVYEIYKVGDDPDWIPGLGILADFGLHAAVIPHFDNGEGGNHDTRFCYMGAARLAHLEALLPPDTGILGIDEHTACIIDIERRVIDVRGRGRVTWRRDGSERYVEAGSSCALDDLTRGRGMTPAPHPPSDTVPADPGDAGSSDGDVCWTAAQRALERNDPQAAAAAILAGEALLETWSADVADPLGRETARAQMRRLIALLGDRCARAVTAPSQLTPLVEVVLRLRGEARAQRRYSDADQLRAALVDAGIQLHDLPEGTAWNVSEPVPTAR